MKSINSVQDYKSVIESGKPVLLDFYADWCGPCQVLLPVVEQLAKQYEDDFTIAKVNVDQNPELAQQFGIRSIPALFFIQNGEVVDRLAGVQSKTTLEAKIQEYSITAE